MSEAPNENSALSCTADAGVVTLTFSHAKGNALPSSLLNRLAAAFDGLSHDPEAKIIVLASKGSATFCAGASFDELRAIRNEAEGKEFFSGFARVILAMRRCPKLILGRVHGKAVGGGVGLIAAMDYAFALSTASVRLSELAIGLGPFVVGPAIERKIGRAAFAAMAIDTDWRDAKWCEQKGLYARVLDTEPALDAVLPAVAHRLVGMNPEAITQLKRVLWEGTNHWDTLLYERAALSGKLALSEHTRRAIEAFAAR